MPDTIVRYERNEERGMTFNILELASFSTFGFFPLMYWPAFEFVAGQGRKNGASGP